MVSGTLSEQESQGAVTVHGYCPDVLRQPSTSLDSAHAPVDATEGDLPYGNGTIVGGRHYGNRELKGVHGVLSAGGCCGAEWCDPSAVVVLAVVTIQRGAATGS